MYIFEPFKYILKDDFTLWASLVAQMVKNLPAMWEIWVWSLGQEDPLEKGMATHSSILAWRIPWTEKPGWLPIHRTAELDTIEQPTLPKISAEAYLIFYHFTYLFSLTQNYFVNDEKPPWINESMLDIIFLIWFTFSWIKWKHFCWKESVHFFNYVRASCHLKLTEKAKCTRLQHWK